jgi:NAD(P)-dependent dehydrogenase (short-subunit alcohol dehydrogenase family)
MRADLSGKVALVTGGGGGIGLAIAKLLAANGASVVIADMNATAAADAAASLASGLGFAMDVREVDQVEGAVAAAIEHFGSLDIVVNNAGINAPTRTNVDAFPIDEWRRVLAVDLDGLFLVSRAASRQMRAAGSGRIINIASITGVVPLRLQSPYVAAKAAVIQLTRSMALELGPGGILVNAIAPGSVITAMTKSLFYAEDGSNLPSAERLLSHIPLRRPGATDEIAQAALFLAAPANSYVTGQTLVVDGGWTAGFSV